MHQIPPLVRVSQNPITMSLLESLTSYPLPPLWILVEVSPNLSLLMLRLRKMTQNTITSAPVMISPYKIMKMKKYVIKTNVYLMCEACVEG